MMMTLVMTFTKMMMMLVSSDDDDNYKNNDDQKNEKRKFKPEKGEIWIAARLKTRLGVGAGDCLSFCR